MFIIACSLSRHQCISQQSPLAPRLLCICCCCYPGSINGLVINKLMSHVIKSRHMGGPALNYNAWVPNNYSYNNNFIIIFALLCFDFFFFCESVVSTQWSRVVFLALFWLGNNSRWNERGGGEEKCPGREKLAGRAAFKASSMASGGFEQTEADHCQASITGNCWEDQVSKNALAESQLKLKPPRKRRVSFVVS